MQKKQTKTNLAMRPALTPEARENQLISLAVDLVEKRLRDGSASSQETTHFLKLASTKARLEKELLEKQSKLVDAKIQSFQSVNDLKELYEEAKAAMTRYKGGGDDEDY